MKMDKKEIEAFEKYAKETSNFLNLLSKMIIWLAKRTLPFHEFEDFVKEFGLQAKGDDNG